MIRIRIGGVFARVAATLFYHLLPMPCHLSRFQVLGNRPDRAGHDGFEGAVNRAERLSDGARRSEQLVCPRPHSDIFGEIFPAHSF